MRISIVGVGHVGLTTAACLAHQGHDVVGVDDDLGKLRMIGEGRVPFFEPGLQELVREGLRTGRLRMGEDASEATRHGEVIFVCVGTPIKETGEPNLIQVEQAARAIAPHLNHGTVVAEKSTVPVGTGERLRRVLERAAPGSNVAVASSPEFLREGTAVDDTLRPTRIVVGAPTAGAHALLREVYRPTLDSTGCPYIATDVPTAELIKLASNAFLATKVSFINAVADVCEAADADVQTVAAAIGMDPRIGPDFLRAGIGYGGYCLPKDVAAFRHKAAQLGVDLGLLGEVSKVNARRLPAVIDKVRDVIWNLEGKRIAQWGLAFKGGTDDLRESPALKLLQLLLDEGANVVAYDPVANEPAKRAMPAAGYAEDPYEAAFGANALVLATDWPEFRAVDLDRLSGVMAEPVIIDGRNLLDPEAARAAGFIYASIGRSTRYPEAGGRPDDPPKRPEVETR